MTNLRVIVGFAAAATLTAADDAKGQHLRATGDGRMLGEAAAEAAFLDSFASTEGDSLSDDPWGSNDTDESSNNMDSINDILTTDSPHTTSPTTSPITDDLTPISTTEEPTSDASASEPAGSGSAVSSTEAPATTASTSASTSSASATVDASTPLPGTETPATDLPTEMPVATATDATSEPSTLETPTLPTATTNADVARQRTPVAPWKQCGGLNFDYTKYFADGVSANWSTKLSCTPGYSCEVVNPWYFQCQQTKDTKAVELWAQCGGANHHGPTNCSTGTVCKYVNDWYSQCVPEANA
ncbi:hypothetical protein PHYPSEUDO_001851 [Phytophthora pseudosyringae]|uniref:CBM1 domain-containing protein n=1 Tax=Phytophthora pseudosyringae TaxID=221518 RepID=A0A8T1VY12_9STRA|nr:hypothetical protein PHYPSEUDO_001851 [Phytophthora pseudosyringae]